MNVRALFGDERAVSQVIGVVLMVAITVLLAATAATFFIGFSDQQNQRAPQAMFTFQYDGNASHVADNLTINHVGGDSIRAKSIYVVVSDASYVQGGTRHDLNNRWTWANLSSGGPSEISAGMSVTLNRDTIKKTGHYAEFSLEGATVKVVWNDPDSSSTFILNSWTHSGS